MKCLLESFVHFSVRWLTLPILEFNLCQLLALQIFSLIYSMYFHFFVKSSDEAAAAAAKSFRLCLTLCDPIDGSPPGSAVSGILQARTLEWVAISFSNNKVLAN